MNDTARAMRLMRIFVATIESLDQDEVEQLLAGKAKLTIVSPKKTKGMSGKPPGDLASISARLNESRDRTKAREILSEITGRDSLAAFARSLKVHVVKHDRREDIESKIVEFVIGGKLRTEAIRSLSLKGGNEERSDEDSKD
ncbi:MAG: hypothetical protein ACTHN2_15515 [Nitrobacter sp.]